MSQTVNFSDSTPSAPGGSLNVHWLNDNSTPPNISANFPAPVFNFSSAAQSQVVVSTTSYYITNSNLAVPNPARVGLAVGSAFTWRVNMTKTNAGTGTFQIEIFLGTNGSASDTAEVTQTLGTQTAAVDQMDLDVNVVWTAVGSSTASFYWTICPHQFAASGTGFGITYPATASYFSGTVSSLNSTTAGLQMGLGFIATTGTPTIVIPRVSANAYNVY